MNGKFDRGSLRVCRGFGTSLAAAAQSGSLSPSGGMEESELWKSYTAKPFEDLQIDHTKTYGAGELSAEQQAQINERCRVGYGTQGGLSRRDGFCTAHAK